MPELLLLHKQKHLQNLLYQTLFDHFPKILFLLNMPLDNLHPLELLMPMLVDFLQLSFVFQHLLLQSSFEYMLVIFLHFLLPVQLIQLLYHNFLHQKLLEQEQLILELFFDIHYLCN